MLSVNALPKLKKDAHLNRPILASPLPKVRFGTTTTPKAPLLSRKQFEDLMEQARQVSETDLNKLTGYPMLNLRGANLSNLDLSGFRLQADLSNANLSKAILNNVDLTGSTFNNTNFNGIDLKTTQFGDTPLNTAKFDWSYNATYTFTNFPGYEKMLRDFEQDTGILFDTPPGTMHAIPSILKGLKLTNPSWLKMAGQAKPGYNLPNEGRLTIDLLNQRDYKHGGAFYFNEAKIRIPSHTYDQNRENVIAHEIGHYFDWIPEALDPAQGRFCKDKAYIQSLRQDLVNLLKSPQDTLSGDLENDLKQLSVNLFAVFPDAKAANNNTDLQFTYGTFQKDPKETPERFKARLKSMVYTVSEVTTMRPNNPSETWAEFYRRLTVNIDTDILAMFPITTQYFKTHILPNPDVIAARKSVSQMRVI